MLKDKTQKLICVIKHSNVTSINYEQLIGKKGMIRLFELITLKRNQKGKGAPFSLPDWFSVPRQLDRL